VAAKRILLSTGGSYSGTSPISVNATTREDLRIPSGPESEVATITQMEFVALHFGQLSSIQTPEEPLHLTQNVSFFVLEHVVMRPGELYYLGERVSMREIGFPSVDELHVNFVQPFRIAKIRFIFGCFLFPSLRNWPRRQRTDQQGKTSALSNSEWVHSIIRSIEFLFE
jgi:hypothetical protein